MRKKCSKGLNSSLKKEGEIKTLQYIAVLFLSPFLPHSIPKPLWNICLTASYCYGNYHQIVFLNYSIGFGFFQLATSIFRMLKSDTWNESPVTPKCLFPGTVLSQSFHYHEGFRRFIPLNSSIQKAYTIKI